jgi:hypothetical protein
MIREEEDDLTQEMRQLVMAKVNEELLTFITKIEEARPPVTDEWTEGVGVGMNWAIRILKKDKSAF